MICICYMILAEDLLTGVTSHWKKVCKEFFEITDLRGSNGTSGLFKVVAGYF